MGHLEISLNIYHILAMVIGQQNFIAYLLINLGQYLEINFDKISKLLIGVDSSLKLVILIH